jgi:hypothetical protein
VKNKVGTVLTVLFSALLVPGGLMLLWFSGRQLINGVGLGPAMVRTTGAVVRVIVDHEGSEAVLVEFTGEDDQQHTAAIVGSPFNSISDLSVGSRVPVVYPRNDPSGALPDTLGGRVVTPAVLVLISLVLILVGAVKAALKLSS